jgi:L-lactate utilization protein LutC
MVSNAREEILGRLRTAERQVSPAKPAAGEPRQIAKGEVEVFLREAQIVSAKVTVVPGKDAIAQGVIELLGEKEVKSLLVVEDKRLDAAAMKKAAKELKAEYISIWELSEKEYLDKAFACDVGITCCDWGVAETASVVIFHRASAPRLPSISPPIHIAILYTSPHAEQTYNHGVILVTLLRYCRLVLADAHDLTGSSHDTYLVQPGTACLMQSLQAGGGYVLGTRGFADLVSFGYQCSLRREPVTGCG